MIGRFFKSGIGILLLTVLLLLGGVGGIVGYQIHTVTHPPRAMDSIHPGDFLMRSDDVTFQSTDGVPLSGWLIHGERDSPPIILCHDLGESKSAFLDSAVVLQRAGYSLLLFDFRGHGASGGAGSTLGSEEAYDVQGAIDFLRTRRDLPADRIGVWGVGMGAYAAILAAAERKQVVALALDSPYPDIQTYLDQVLFRGVPQAASSVTRYASAFYGPYFRWKIYKGSAARVVPRLADRNFLFVVSAARPGSVETGRRLYELLPDGGQADRNLLELGLSGFSGSYASDRRKYEEAITAFFNTYLQARREKPPDPIRLQVR